MRQEEVIGFPLDYTPVVRQDVIFDYVLAHPASVFSVKADLQ